MSAMKQTDRSSEYWVSAFPHAEMRTDACGKAARSLSLLVCPTVFDYFMCALSPQLIDQGEPARRKLASDIGKVVPGLEQALYGAATSRVRFALAPCDYWCFENSR